MNALRMLKPLYMQVLVAAALGVLVGILWPETGTALKPLGDGFIKLIRMIIAPVVFCTVAIGIAHMSDLKKFGRVGDTAIIGAGTYADELCAVSCTGHGEYFQRTVTAYDVAARKVTRRLDLPVKPGVTLPSEEWPSVGTRGLVSVGPPVGRTAAPSMRNVRVPRAIGREL